MTAICGANCTLCELYKNSKCKGCKETNGCPFGTKCWIANYIEIGGKDSFESLKKDLIKEFNSLNIEGMPKINELYPLHGDFVNMEYPLPNGKYIKFLNDNEAYLGNQVECLFNDEGNKKCFGILANMHFLLVCEYGENGTNPELIIYKRR
ncbi:MAG: DUF3795 domain-containing protein [Bacilli bacterium]|nr:DUF3795 domain-containing protein [Bacilli bacterium]